MKSIVVLCLLVVSFTLSAQPEANDWYFADPASSTYNGIGVDKLYSYIGNKTPSSKVIVAILDSGVDIDHDDLKDNIWVNTDEIPENGIDDDKNGYVDDVHGWNFLGNPNGQNITKETLEVTRLYAFYKTYFAHKDLKKLSRKDQYLYTDFLQYERTVQNKRTEAMNQANDLNQNLQFIRTVMDTFESVYPGQQLTVSFIESFDPAEDQLLNIAKEIFNNAQAYGMELTDTKALLSEIEDSYDEVNKESKENLDYRYNPDFHSREIIGDNYLDQKECCYGNSDVRGGFAFHGTHISGIVGAEWNDIGMRGIARNVLIMPVRTVPNGDEHDKDVANAIRYAVDNGASVINMSFGKGQSWNKKVVDAAVRYARKHDVLLVHGAGNDADDNDVTGNFPNANYDKRPLFGKKIADNWLEVGATSYEKGEHAIAPFSNYGKHSVDLFAPGMHIYSTAPNASYEYADGTSMASPVAAGVAAVIRAYFPKLKAHEVRDVLMDSVMPFSGDVDRPGDNAKVPASELSRSGGVVNAYQAYKLAEQRAAKNAKVDSQKSVKDGRA